MNRNKIELNRKHLFGKNYCHWTEWRAHNGLAGMAYYTQKNLITYLPFLKSKRREERGLAWSRQKQ